MRRLLLAAVLLLTVSLAADAPRPAQRPATPADPAIRLVLLVSVDQLRPDYLTRFRSEYTGGFARLLTDGASFTDALLEHYPTVTAVGHMAMSTGALPAVSGIIGNDWYDRSAGTSVTSVSDPGSPMVGAEGTGSSPHRLQVPTIGDEMKSAAAAGAAPKVIGVSLKDRSAILMSGHQADAAIWADGRSGSFVTSTYYGTELPAWAAAFNTRRAFDTFAGRLWEFAGAAAGPGRTLPAEPGGQLYGAIAGSPFGNQLVTELAVAALEAERLGLRGVTDLLAVSYSSNDSVGHSYGPESPEVRDVSIQTDRLLGDLFARVEATVGLAHTLVVLSADHGVAPLPEDQQARKLPGGRLPGSALFDPIEAALDARYGDAQWILGTAGTSPYLNHAVAAERGVDQAEMRRVAAAAAMGVEQVARVYTREQLIAGDVPPDAIGRRIARSYHLQRSGDLEIVLQPYWIRSTRGTTHGTPYRYDANVPLVFMGPGIRPGTYHHPVAVNDLAPTVAALVGVPAPGGSSGRVLTEALTAASVASPQPGPTAAR